MVIGLPDIKRFQNHPVPRNPADQLNWNARQWREVADQLTQIQSRLDFVVANYTFGGHGSLQINAPVAVPDLLPGVWVRLKPWQVKGSELYVKTSVPDGTHDILVAGVWQIIFTLQMQHNELNQGRNARLRMVNAVTNVPVSANVVMINIPRDTPESRFVGVVLFDITDQNGVDPLALEISADVGDTITGVSYVQGNWSLANIGPWRGTLPGGGGGFKR
jgi:hypothetical protein